jgi:hypothetical protein
VKILLVGGPLKSERLLTGKIGTKKNDAGYNTCGCFGRGIMSLGYSILYLHKIMGLTRRKKEKKMSFFEIENVDDEKKFLGDLTKKEFYTRLHFLREHGGHK